MRRLMVVVLLAAMLAGCIDMADDSVVQISYAIPNDIADASELSMGLARAVRDGYVSNPNADTYIMDVSWNFLPVAKITIPGDKLRGAAGGTVARDQLKASMKFEFYTDDIPDEALAALKGDAPESASSASEAEKQAAIDKLTSYVKDNAADDGLAPGEFGRKCADEWAEYLTASGECINLQNAGQDSYDACQKQITTGDAYNACKEREGI